MGDSKLESYARLLVERCIGVEPGWQVLVESTPLARPLLEEVARIIARRGAYALIRSNYASIGMVWAKEVDDSLLGELPPIEKYAREQCDAVIIIVAPENTRDGTSLPPEKLALLARAAMPFRQRLIRLDVPWVGCQFPTPALAQDAGMSLSDFEELLYGACLLDWDYEAKRMRRYADRFDSAREVRIVGKKSDVWLSLEGRNAMVDDGRRNMPGGEFFYSPVEDATEGTITFSEFPAIYQDHEVTGAQLTFKQGRVIEASAQSGEDFLIKTLDSDGGARILGEFGIGCNPGINRHMKNTLFDEKIYGTVHFAVGNGFPYIGGKNISQVHWDFVKDLRAGGEIYLEGELVQKNGEWLI